VLLDRRPARLTEALAEADFYGIGVLIETDAGIEPVVSPEDYRPVRRTAAAWAFLEDVYRRVQ
jgi:hypothetical protein